MTTTHQLIPAPAVPDIRLAGARAVLREARHRGHDYVELREVGRRVVFFCTLCLTQCFGDATLWAHLRGSLHARRRAAATRTLFGPLPWPFSDGVLFFSSFSPEINTGKADLVIADALVGERISQMPLWISGVGHLTASLRGLADGALRFRIWCAWLGEGSPEDVDVLSTAPDCDVAIVNLRYRCDLGRRNTTEELTLYLEDGGGSPRKRIRKSFSDPEESGELSTEQGDSEESSNRLLSSDDSRGGGLRLTSSKAIRREMRRRERLVAERICDICRQRMLPGKDVATLLNLKTGRLACSSRNTNGVSTLGSWKVKSLELV